MPDTSALVDMIYAALQCWPKGRCAVMAERSAETAVCAGLGVARGRSLVQSIRACGGAGHSQCIRTCQCIHTCGGRVTGMVQADFLVLREVQTPSSYRQISICVGKFLENFSDIEPALPISLSLPI